MLLVIVLVPILVLLEAPMEDLELELLLYFEALGSQVLELPLKVEVLQLQAQLA